MNDTITLLGNNIKTFRTQAGLSQEQLANISGIERSQLSKIESGLINGVTLITIIKIFNSLGMELKYVKKEEQNDIFVHPFVKWAGGKTQLLDVIESHMPINYNRYFEPFVGGGALLFKLQPQTFFINDMNSELISVYKCFENDELYSNLIIELEKHEKNHSEEYYYQVREMDKDPSFEKQPTFIRAARMVYLNKACFNGLYRVNAKGYFNVPSGKKANVKCFDRDNFHNLRLFFEKHKPTITNQDFEQAVNNAKAGDFVYFDPPYDSWDEKDSFTSYDKGGFGKEEQARLAKVYKKLSDNGVYVMLSNHNTKYINELYKGFHINVVPAKRMINSNANGRGAVEEVLVTNYE